MLVSEVPILKPRTIHVVPGHISNIDMYHPRATGWGGEYACINENLGSQCHTWNNLSNIRTDFESVSGSSLDNKPRLESRLPASSSQYCLNIRIHSIL